MVDDYEKLKNEIVAILGTKLNELKKEIVDEITKKMESQKDMDPYANLSVITQEAMNQVKRELANALQRGNQKEIDNARKKQEDIQKALTKIAQIVEQIKGEEENSIQYENPLYPKKRLHQVFPWVYYRKSHKRSSRNWVALLFAGVGLGLIFTGIGEASLALQSIQGSLIMGTIILALLAWLERKKVFSLLGQE